ncbi:hypothetical protein CEXT_807071 [Caerostris extrusa]|uniref:Uncharacterized protein n=1 Tax=Caerostris extrusa TaxID=172846 RepID=A0AAV4NWY0_CAEEX|nr:hypothetical protein CEXT_807071 [Caerostris extrusa]
MATNSLSPEGFRDNERVAQRWNESPEGCRHQTSSGTLAFQRFAGITSCISKGRKKLLMAFGQPSPSNGTKVILFSLIAFGQILIGQ